jgi:hypothetical protein
VIANETSQNCFYAPIFHEIIITCLFHILLLCCESCETSIFVKF